MDNGNPMAINFMKGGIVYANYVNTVSPPPRLGSTIYRSRLWLTAHASRSSVKVWRYSQTVSTTAFGAQKLTNQIEMTFSIDEL